MRIFRYKPQLEGRPILAALTEEGKVYDLSAPDLMSLVGHARSEGITPTRWVEKQLEQAEPRAESAEELDLVVPLDAPEVWAAGVTYERSRQARNYEATGGKLDATTFYDKVYDAERPEIFFKSTAARTVGPNDALYLRSDSNWQIPEPELGLVLDSDATIIGYTIGNDMSCRDIEGENPLYLPQAKIWRHSCAIGPYVRLAETVEDPYQLRMTCQIYRDDRLVTEGEASIGQLKRKLEELVSFLARDNELFSGTVLLTGTCIVPPNDFTLHPGDRVDITIDGIGTLSNVIEAQPAR